MIRLGTILLTDMYKKNFEKCQIFPDIVVFRGNDEKTTISFSPQKFGRDPSLHHGEGVSGPQATLMDTPY